MVSSWPLLLDLLTSHHVDTLGWYKGNLVFSILEALEESEDKLSRPHAVHPIPLACHPNLTAEVQKHGSGPMEKVPALLVSNSRTLKPLHLTSLLKCQALSQPSAGCIPCPRHQSSVSAPPKISLNHYISLLLPQYPQILADQDWRCVCVYMCQFRWCSLSTWAYRDLCLVLLETRRLNKKSHGPCLWGINSQA